MANTNLLDHLDIFPKAPRLNGYSVDGKPNWSQQHYAAAREKKEKEKKLFKQASCGTYGQEWFLPGLWCVPLISSRAAKISMELCVQSGALEFKLIEEPGQRDYSGTTQMMKGLENTVNNHVRPKKYSFFSIVEKRHQREAQHWSSNI